MAEASLATKQEPCSFLMSLPLMKLLHIVRLVRSQRQMSASQVALGPCARVELHGWHPVGAAFSMLPKAIYCLASEMEGNHLNIHTYSRCIVNERVGILHSH